MTSEDVATRVLPLLELLLDGEPPIRVEFWDDSGFGPADAPDTIKVRSPDALRRILWAPGELGLARAFVAGDIDFDGSMERVLRSMQSHVRQHALLHDQRTWLTSLPSATGAARSLGALGRPLPPPPEEIVPRGLRHSIQRDRVAVSHHYDVGNEFYSLVLGPAMTYSCARFVSPDVTLAEAQASKHELICRKLGLAEDDFRARCASGRPRLLDVGCGWGSMAIHAAQHHDVDVVGVTISKEQAAMARKRVAEAGVADRVDIRLQDYREVDDGPYDAISSIGMAEHVGLKRMDRYFSVLHEQLRDGGRVLNHAIASVGGSKLSSRSFVGRYVFPDGELLDLADTISSMERTGFEVRDVENLREHYATTLRCWVANLEEHWDAAVALVGERRARVWRLYMSGSVNGFLDGGLQLYQTLGVKAPDGVSGLPPTRAAWV